MTATGLRSDDNLVSATARVDGKFLDVLGQRFLVKGVAYGTFAPDADGHQFPPLPRLDADFGQMGGVGINTVRTYTAPTDALLDTASRHDLRVMAGLAWSQHLPFLDDRRVARQIRRDAVAAARRLATHPALLMLAVGNEIPAAIVRWHGPRRVERFLRELAHDIRSVAPDTLLTYVNFPPTEFLELDAFDVASFNVYLHAETDLTAYLARLQHLAGPKPLLLAEAGSDSIRQGQRRQAELTAMQLQAAFTEGACGAVAYSWTDEWWRGGQTVEDWAFGLVDTERDPKPALSAVTDVFSSVPFPAEAQETWPHVTVVVCAYNAADTIDDCLTALDGLTYPNVEILVVNDGSTDATADIASRYPRVRVINISSSGLCVARNTGLAEATGDIVAYTDADCRVDPDWLTYLVQPFLHSDLVGVGGPNVVPPDDPWMAQSVARAPGGPTQVMLDDRIAEHIPGCNMAFSREALLSIDGFNPVYLRAGDDVDICWRLQAQHHEIGFAPAALVWHHHRASIKAYWRQQVGYGEGEAWLDAHHPEKFLAGQATWGGRIYGSLPFLHVTADQRVNTGVWGTASFPSVYATHTHHWRYLPHQPAWLVASLALLFVGVFGPLAGMDAAWLPLVAGAAGVVITLARCAVYAWRTPLTGLPSIGRWSPRQSRWLYRVVITWLHLLQPLARLRGRIRGLSRPAEVTPQHVTRFPWRTPTPSPVPTPRKVWSLGRLVADERVSTFWSESWVSHTAFLTELVGVLRAARPAQLVDVDEGWRPDRDVSLAVGRWGWLHVRTLVEEHERGRCLLRVRARLRLSFGGTLRSVAAALVAAVGTAASLALYTPSVSVVVLTASMAAIGARAAWQVARASKLLEVATSRATRTLGLRTLDVPASHDHPDVDHMVPADAAVVAPVGDSVVTPVADAATETPLATSDASTR